jgi:SAM-dependent methyltransferase
MVKYKPYLDIVNHYEKCLRLFGDSHLGVDWRDPNDAEKRYQVMLDIIQRKAGETVKLLDFGCGTAGLYDYINKKGISNIEYAGLDISSAFIKVSQKKYPNIRFFNVDILDPDTSLPNFDYIIMNGVFTEKISLSFEQMFEYFCSVLERAFPYCRKGIAFNVRSNQVDNKEEDLFHLPFDSLAWFLIKQVSRHFLIRNDYGLEEYTVYLYQNSLAS